MFAVICMKSIYTHVENAPLDRNSFSEFLKFDPILNSPDLEVFPTSSILDFSILVCLPRYRNLHITINFFFIDLHSVRMPFAICGGPKTRAMTHIKPKHRFMPTNCVSMKLPRKNNPSIEMKVDLNSKWGKTPKEILH